MPLRLAAALAAIALLVGCGSPRKLSIGDVERLLEGKNGPNVVCTEGTDGWDYTCRTTRRKIGVDLGDHGVAELSSWTPIGEPMQVGPGGEGPAVDARFVDEANAVCRQTASMVTRLPQPVSRADALARMDQVRNFRFVETAQLDAIKPPVALQADYTAMIGARKAVMDDEMQLRDGIATGSRSTRRAALASRRRDAHQANEIALRLGLVGCSAAAIPIPGIAP
jgi:hypothetical protein